MIIDGKKIAREIEENLTDIVSQGEKRTLVVIIVGHNPASISYTKLKKMIGERIGVKVDLIHLEENTTEEELKDKIQELNKNENIHGVIVQLPLPSEIDTESVLAKISSEKDIDGLSGKSVFNAPVALAIEEILSRSNVTVSDKTVAIIGRGRLVGIPVAKWFRDMGANVEIISRDTKDISRVTLKADIIVSGAGSPYLLKPDMIKKGVIVIDAGTSEESGKLVGDVDPECADKCSLFTPVPGGVGPLTIVMLFKNLLKTHK